MKHHVQQYQEQAPKPLSIPSTGRQAMKHNYCWLKLSVFFQPFNTLNGSSGNEATCTLTPRAYPNALSIPSTGRQAMKLPQEAELLSVYFEAFNTLNGSSGNEASLPLGGTCLLGRLSIPSTGRQAMKLAVRDYSRLKTYAFQYPQRVVRQ